uniref:CSON002523 protein n=1 Tax=Culicoides sonorensis TaxID=179676 RepID=A0A336LVN9_CULSO
MKLTISLKFILLMQLFSLASSVGSVYPYLGEFIPIKYRQTIMSVASFSIGLSLIYVPGVAWLLLPLDFRFSIFGLFEFRPWRALILCCALPGLALLWITRPIITLFLFTSFITLSGIMVSVVTGAAVLLFPTNYRAMAVCIILTLGRLGTILGTNFLGAFLYVNCEVTIGVITGYVLLAAYTSQSLISSCPGKTEFEI